MQSIDVAANPDAAPTNSIPTPLRTQPIIIPQKSVSLQTVNSSNQEILQIKPQINFHDP